MLTNPKDFMPFVFDDGGRKESGRKGFAGDCVVRSVAIATQQPYESVYSALSDGCRAQRNTKRSKARSSARNGVNTSRKWFKDYMRSLGWKWTPTMQVGSGCTTHLVSGELPPGRLVVAVSKHYTAVIDGVVHDTHDPQRATIVTTDGISRAQYRCVYGYWSPA